MRAFATTPGVQVAKRLHHMMRVVNCKHHLLQFVLTRAWPQPDKGGQQPLLECCEAGHTPERGL